MLSQNDLHQKAKDIRCLICDLDGVLTDGYLYVDDNAIQNRAFYIQDGFGVKLLMLSGVDVSIITNSDSPLVLERFKMLGLKHGYHGQFNKLAAYEDLKSKLKVDDAQVAYIGDDLPDIALMQKVGLGVAVQNANEKVIEIADWVTAKPGGRGGVREVCDLIMQAQNTLDAALVRYYE